MKKLLLGTAAIALGLAMTAPAHAADGVKLGIGGFFTGYMSWLDQDEEATTPASVESFGILRDTEVHFTGETTLDNGLTVGFHTEIMNDVLDTGNLGFVEESYAYFSGSWGRVNFGAEDGAAYLLQVSAPSADNNVDGLRQYVHGVNYASLGDDVNAAATDPELGDLFAGSTSSAGLVLDDLISFGADGADDGGDDVQFGDLSAAFGFTVNTVFDYDQALSASEDKITYLTPVFSGFQGGVSYAPNLNTDSEGDPAGPHPVDNTIGVYDGAWDVAARWEGTFNKLGINAGAGYSHTSLQADLVAPAADVNFIAYIDANSNEVADAGEETTTLDDRDAWNVGLDLNWGAFGLGGAFTRDNIGISNGFDRDTWVVGADYTTGPYKLGLSYLNQEQEIASVASFDTDRWTAGAIYTYGPGMTFRGSVAWMDYEEDIGTNAAGSNSEANSTNFLLGTEIDF